MLYDRGLACCCMCMEISYKESSFRLDAPGMGRSLGDIRSLPPGLPGDFNGSVFL